MYIYVSIHIFIQYICINRILCNIYTYAHLLYTEYYYIYRYIYIQCNAMQQKHSAMPIATPFAKPFPSDGVLERTSDARCWDAQLIRSCERFCERCCE